MSATKAVVVPCPICQTPVEMPYSLTTSPIHAIDERRLTMHLNDEAWKKHLATHPRGPKGGIPIAVAA